MVTPPRPLLTLTEAVRGTVTTRLVLPLELPSTLTRTASPVTVTWAFWESKILLASLSSEA